MALDPITSVLPRPVDFILSEADGQRSRENAIVTQSGAALLSGQVLTKVGDTGTAAFAMDAGATGNPTSSAITVGAKAVPGVYRIKFDSATKAQIEDPDGQVVGEITLGSAFSGGGLGFTLSAGGNAAVLGDMAKITVAEGNGKYAPYQAAGAAGPADAILYSPLGPATGDAKVVIINTDAEVSRFKLTGLDAAAEADLRKKGIKVRGTSGLPHISTPAL